jgi:hypothetical protein
MMMITAPLLFKLPGLRSRDAFVLGRIAFFKSDAPSLELVNHETIHQEQMDKHGVLGFYLIYFLDYLSLRLKGFSHNNAYKNIPFEIEAYKEQGKLL